MKNRAIISYTGLLLAGLGIVFLLPLFSLLFFRAEVMLSATFILLSIASMSAGLFLWRKFKPEEDPALTTPDAALIVTLIWLLAVLLGSVPFYASGSLALIDSVFEAMSGWTTTGLTMVNPEETFPMLLLWRALMQFVGGAGFIVIMLSAIVGGLGPGAYQAEARTDRLFPNIKYTARMIVKIYSAYCVLGIILYSYAGMELFDAVCHTLSGLSTGGFSTRAGSIGWWNSPGIEAVTIFLMLAGTVNFATHHAMLSSRGKKGWRDAELRLMALLVIAGAFLVFFFLPGASGLTPLFQLRQSFFQTVSALTGTGYTTADIAPWGALPLFVLVLMMIIEGGTGSTAGGIKQYRVAIIIKSIWWWIKKQSYPPSALIRRNIWRRGELLEIEDRHIQAVAAFIGIYLMTYTAGVLIFLAHGYSLQESLFEVASALGTVGLSSGITNPGMPAACKITQILAMWLGRLEFVAIFHAVIRIGKRTR